MPAAATTKPFGKFTDREGYDGRTIGVNKFIKYEALLLLLLRAARHPRAATAATTTSPPPRPPPSRRPTRLHYH